MAAQEESSPSGSSRLPARIMIDVVRDGIEQVVGHRKLDAIVSSDDTYLSMGGGISAAILRLAGQGLAREAARLVPLRVGDVAVTSAGRLPVRHVLHAVTVDWKHHILPTERTVRQLLRDLLVRCEALQLRQVAFPVIGAGAARFPSSVSARLFFQALVDHFENPTVLTDLVLTIPDSSVFEELAKETRALFDSAARDMRQNVVVRIGGSALETSKSTLDVDPGEVAQDRLGEAATHEEARPAPRASPSALRWPFPRRGPTSQDTASAGQEAAQGKVRLWTSSTLAGSGQGGGLHGSRAFSSGEWRPIIGTRYVLLEELGRGGFGVVHLSWDLVLRRVVAIKRLREGATNPEALRKEAAVALDLNHEGIVRVHHFEPRPDQGGPFLVMEYVPWLTAEKWVADAGEGLLPVPAVLEVGAQLCRALGHAHERGVLHLDIKPGNIFVDEAAENAKLSDFGFARAVAEHGHRALQIQFGGTPAYMAPEQRVAGRKLSRATDVFQLAATLWDMLTGEPPGAGTGERVVNQERRGLLDMLRAAMAPDVAARPPDASAFSSMLAAARAGI